MGTFVSVLIVKDNKEENMRKTLEKMENHSEWNLIAAKCQYQQCDNVVTVLLNDMCSDYERDNAETFRKIGVSCDVVLYL